MYACKGSSSCKLSVFEVFLVCVYPYLDWIRRFKSPHSVQKQENTDQKNSEYWHFLCNVFNSSNIFFAYQSHVDFLLYSVLVFTALKNSKEFSFGNLTLYFIMFKNGQTYFKNLAVFPHYIHTLRCSHIAVFAHFSTLWNKVLTNLL